MKTLQLEDTEALLLAVALRAVVKEDEAQGGGFRFVSTVTEDMVKALGPFRQLIAMFQGLPGCIPPDPAAEPKPAGVCAYCGHNRLVHQHEEAGAKCTMANCTCQGYGEK